MNEVYEIEVGDYVIFDSKLNYKIAVSCSVSYLYNNYDVKEEEFKDYKCMSLFRLLEIKRHNKPVYNYIINKLNEE